MAGVLQDEARGVVVVLWIRMLRRRWHDLALTSLTHVLSRPRAMTDERHCRLRKCLRRLLVFSKVRVVRVESLQGPRASTIAVSSEKGFSK